MKYCIILIFSVSCNPHVPNPQTAVDLAGYSVALDKCRAKGKAAGSYEIYEECAKEADKIYGRKETP